jgi:hypothetical protein
LRERRGAQGAAFSSLTHALARTQNVRVKSESSDSPTFLYYQDSRPMIALDELRARWKPEFHRVNLSAAEFFARCARAARGDTSSENAVYYSSTVSEWRGSGLEDEVGDPGHMFREALPAGARPSLHVWMGSAGVTSAAHYDAVHNFYVQIYGHKRFVLLPPASDRVLYTYPRLHPSARQSQIAFHRPDTAQFPLLFEPPSSEPPGHLQARDVVLAPGDVLYLPPYWFHYVTALDTSISLSLWLDAEELTWFRAASSHDVPLKSGASDAERRELAARYLALFLSAFAQGLERASGVPQAPPRDLVARMLNTRFIAFDTPPSPSSEPVLRGCGGPELVSEELLSRLDATAKAAVLDLLRVPESAEAVAAESVAARQLRDMRHEDNRAVAEIQAMDYVEEMLQAAVGADRVQPFLVALAERCLV